MKKLNVKVCAFGEHYEVVNAKIQIPNIESKEHSKEIVNEIIAMCKSQMEGKEIIQILVDYGRINSYSDMIYCGGKTLHEDCLYIPVIKCETISLDKFVK